MPGSALGVLDLCREFQLGHPLTEDVEDPSVPLVHDPARLLYGGDLGRLLAPPLCQNDRRHVGNGPPVEEFDEASVRTGRDEVEFKPQ